MMDFVPTMLDTPATLIDPLRTTLRQKLIEETVQKMQKKKSQQANHDVITLPMMKTFKTRERLIEKWEKEVN